MRRLTSSLIGTAVALGSVVIGASPASAGTPGSITETAVTGSVQIGRAHV